MGEQPDRDRLMVVGASVTALGMVLSLIAMLPLATDIQLSGLWWFLSMVTGVGLATMFVGFWRAARARSHAVTTALPEVHQG